jgi:CRP-like cAMP-binding protein
VGYVVEGLVRGVWHRSRLAPASRATAIVSGDGRWIGADAFQYGKNLFRYAALTPTTASLIPLGYLRDEAPRPVLFDALWSVSLAWCTSASVASLGSESLARRTLLLLYDMSRLHPRPEIEVRQKDIADMLGVARQTLQPVLKALQERGLIDLGYGEIIIGEPIQLARKLRAPRPPAPKAPPGPKEPPAEE